MFQVYLRFYWMIIIYEFLKQGKIIIEGVTVLNAAYLIPFKAKAWMDLTDRKAAGEQVDSKNY